MLDKYLASQMTYSPKVAAALEARRDHRMPLGQGGRTPSEFAASQGRELFPKARDPQAALAGFVLFMGDWEKAHAISQDIETAEGSYWHGIVHRQEPDPGNSGYWFRQVGEHAIFPALQRDAQSIVAGYPKGVIDLPAVWDPVAFVEICEAARRSPGSPLEQAAVEIQHAEWLRLFQWCCQAPETL